MNENIRYNIDLSSGGRISWSAPKDLSPEEAIDEMAKLYISALYGNASTIKSLDRHETFVDRVQAMFEVAWNRFYNGVILRNKTKKALDQFKRDVDAAKARYSKLG